MIPMSQWIRTLTVAVVVALSTTVASPQSVDAPQANGHQDHDGQTTQPSTGHHATATMPRDMMARMAAMDDRIEMLVAEMNSFAGEMKVTAMAALLTALVEQQAMMRNDIMPMHQTAHRTAEPMTSAAGVEPEMMCSDQAAELE